jgi:FKBP-type peptidyl-prolyl cis-trans isomerase
LKIFKFISLGLVVLSICLLFSCNQNKKSAEEQKNNQDIEESLLKVNKKLVKSEDEQIEDFLTRYGWKMDKTGTGLRYLIYEQGSGKKAEEGKIAIIEFTVSLLNGDVCYTSEEEGPKEFLIGQGGVESGLEEGILFLKEGDRAKFIIPSHLAFGLVGDMDKIPAKAAVVYDLKLIELK